MQTGVFSVSAEFMLFMVVQMLKKQVGVKMKQLFAWMDTEMLNDILIKNWFYCN